MTARILLFIAVVALFGSTQEPELKLDKELVDVSTKQPIFVRFEDQLFKKGGDYESFCAVNKDVPRSALRKASLHNRCR